MVLAGTFLRGELVRHIDRGMVGATRGTVLATFLDLHAEPMAAVAWRGGAITITALRYLDRLTHDFTNTPRSFL